jgi:pentatricopeptide repeat protein
VYNHFLRNNSNSSSNPTGDGDSDSLVQTDYVTNSFITMLARCGCIERARQVFSERRRGDKTPMDVVTWNSMISACAQHGLAEEALSLFREMQQHQQEGIRPNEVTFISLLAACSHTGDVDSAVQLFESMERDWKIKPNVRHWNCLVDVFGRAGRLDEAEQVIHRMTMSQSQSQPNVVTWMTLLGACRSQGDVARAERAVKAIESLPPHQVGVHLAAAYVLLSNIYAQQGRMADENRIREMMDQRGIHKIPGLSTVEIDGQRETFVAHEDSLESSSLEDKDKYAQLYLELAKLECELRQVGYVPDLTSVTRGANDAEKEHFLCAHSEKLAISYALLKTPAGTPIRITKNLRVCKDCHTATKLISLVRKREIVVRDANRFHHFKEGRCSCGDYW